MRKREVRVTGEAKNKGKGGLGREEDRAADLGSQDGVSMTWAGAEG